MSPKVLLKCFLMNIVFLYLTILFPVFLSQHPLSPPSCACANSRAACWGGWVFIQIHLPKICESRAITSRHLGFFRSPLCPHRGYNKTIQAKLFLVMIFYANDSQQQICTTDINTNIVIHWFTFISLSVSLFVSQVRASGSWSLSSSRTCSSGSCCWLPASLLWVNKC